MRSDLAVKSKTLRRLVLLTLLYLLPPLRAIYPVTDPDIWWHLRTGQWIVEHGTVPKVDPFSSYGMGKAWVAYSWLFEVMVYGLYRAFGLVGIVLYTTLLSLLIAAAFHRLVHRFALPFAEEILLTAFGLAGMMLLFSPRSWLFTILFFIVELDLILMARRSGSSRNLWLLPPLFVVWANTHIQFIYGLFLLALAMVEPLLEKVLRLSPAGSTTRPIPFNHLSLIFTACTAATLFTPYHLHLYPTLIGLIQQTGQFRDVIEMQPLPFREPWSWFVLAAALGAAFSLGRQRDVHAFPLLSLIAGAFLSFRGRRDLWFIVVTAIPIIAASRSPADSPHRFPLTKLRLAIVAGALIIALAVVGWKRNISVAHLESVAAEHYPAAAAAAIEERDYQGPLYNNYDWGGYLIWRLRSIPVVMDNRGNVHGDERIRRSMETWSGLDNWDSDPELLSARLVIASVKTALASLLRLDSRFEVVYEDKVAAVFVARTQIAAQRTTTLQVERRERFDESAGSQKERDLSP